MSQLGGVRASGVARSASSPPVSCRSPNLCPPPPPPPLSLSSFSPIEASKVPICNGRFTEGFRTPALCRRAGLGAGPASESLVRRKPRGGRALFGWARPMGI